MSRGQYRILIHGLAIFLGTSPPFLLIHGLGVEYTYPMVLVAISSIPLYLINIRYLIPRLILKQKYALYLLFILGVVVCYALIFNFSVPFNFDQILVVSPNGDQVSLPRFPFPPTIPFLSMMLIGTTIEMLLAYESRGKQIEQTQTEKVMAELSFLKSQINPHFFFNTLNSIYALAAIDSYNTQRAILLLSNLMRYLLYESNVDKVSLNKEVQFLNDFIGLQELRASRKNGRHVDFSHSGNVDNFKIEPLLLMPFVENAFKHSHSYDKQTDIEISIAVEDDKNMTFKCLNSIGEQKEQIEKSSGIGLENVKRRLELIYPESHALNIKNDSNLFDVTLTISNEVYSS